MRYVILIKRYLQESLVASKGDYAIDTTDLDRFSEDVDCFDNPADAEKLANKLRSKYPDVTFEVIDIEDLPEYCRQYLSSKSTKKAQKMKKELANEMHTGHIERPLESDTKFSDGEPGEPLHSEPIEYVGVITHDDGKESLTPIYDDYQKADKEVSKLISRKGVRKAEIFTMRDLKDKGYDVDKIRRSAKKMKKNADLLNRVEALYNAFHDNDAQAQYLDDYDYDEYAINAEVLEDALDMARDGDFGMVASILYDFQKGSDFMESEVDSIIDACLSYHGSTKKSKTKKAYGNYMDAIVDFIADNNGVYYNDLLTEFSDALTEDEVMDALESMLNNDTVCYNDLNEKFEVCKGVKKSEWTLRYRDHDGEVKTITGDKFELMDKGHELLENNITGSCILSNGVRNAKCWWHAGRTEWSDFVNVGDFYTSSTKKSVTTGNSFEDMVDKMRNTRRFRL